MLKSTPQERSGDGMKALNKREMLQRLKELEKEATMSMDDFCKMLHEKFPESSAKVEDYYPIMVGWLTGGIQGIIQDAERKVC